MLEQTGYFFYRFNGEKSCETVPLRWDKRAKNIFVEEIPDFNLDTFIGIYPGILEEGVRLLLDEGLGGRWWRRTATATAAAAAAWPKQQKVYCS